MLKTSHRMLRHILGSLVLLSLITVLPLAANAELLITPKRLILDDSKRVGEFRALNTSSEPKLYGISWRQIRMSETGQIYEIKEPNAPGSASDIVRVSPSQVSLQPGQAQTIRVHLRKPANLPLGEYISHLTFKPKTTGQSQGGSGGSGVGIQLKVNIGFSLPVIVRNGTTTASTSISAKNYDGATSKLTVEIGRKGVESVFGNVKVYWGPDENALSKIGEMNGVALYANVKSRQLGIPIEFPNGQPEPGVIFIRYMSPDAKSVLAETGLSIN